MSRNTCLFTQSNFKKEVEKLLLGYKKGEVITLILKKLLKKFKNDLEKIFNNIKKDNKFKIMDPELELQILKLFHKEFGHIGIINSYYTLSRYFDIVNLKDKIQTICNSCKKCFGSKYNSKKMGLKNEKIFSKHRLHVVSSDIVGPILTEDFDTNLEQKKFYLILFTDIYSRFTKVYILNKKNGKEICNKIKMFIKNYGKFKYFVSDNGKGYTSKNISDYFKRLNIKHNLVPSYTPSSNGISKRLNKTINDVLRNTEDTNLERY